MSAPRISFGDNVIIRATADTERLGLAGKNGRVHGHTAPSNSGVTVVGTLSQDYALNVFFDDIDADFWFAEEDVQFVDHGVGAEVRLDGVDKRWVRTSDGDWDEQPIEQPSRTKSWWKFWR